MRSTIIIEKAKDGHFSCYMGEDTLNFGLVGHGETAAEAKADLMAAYSEIKEMKKEEGEEVPDLNFEFKYDLQSFFDYFGIINVSQLAREAGINASLLRRYRSGAAKASQMQYDRLQNAIHKIAYELSTARF